MSSKSFTQSQMGSANKPQRKRKLLIENKIVAKKIKTSDILDETHTDSKDDNSKKVKATPAKKQNLQRKRKVLIEGKRAVKKIKADDILDEIQADSKDDNSKKVKTKLTKDTKLHKVKRSGKETTGIKKLKKDSKTTASSSKNVIQNAVLNKVWEDEEYLAEAEGISLNTSINIIELFKEENTIPFIARYRCNLTGGLKPDKLRKIKSTYENIIKVRKKANQLVETVKQKGPPPPDLLLSIQSARTLEELEFLGAPYKKDSKRTLAERAKELGLEKPSLRILKGETVDFNSYVNPFVDGLAGPEKVKLGIQHILADIISKDAQVLQLLENIKSSKNVVIQSTYKMINVDQFLDQLKYRSYENFSQSTQTIKPHQVLAINRGENEKFLTVKVVIPESLWTPVIRHCTNKWGKPKTHNIIRESVDDAIKRLLNPLVVRRIRAKLNKEAEDEAVNIFVSNLRQLLLTPPCLGKVVLAIDPGFKFGCKVAVLNSNGDFLEYDKFYLSNQKSATQKLIKLMKNYKCSTIALGNGKGCRETESFLSSLIGSGAFKPLDVSYTIINEQGISVYSCSSVGQEEFPDLEPTIISAISLGRRLQNPLSELVKVEPKHLGVGMYQHDVDEKKLMAALEEVVMECVSFVGVDVNTASYHLLKYIAGLNESRAKEIVKYRAGCFFRNREDLKKIKGIGPKTFLQCAGFIRIKPSTAGYTSDRNIDLNPLDETGIHPESYEVVTRLIKDLGLNLKDLGSSDFIKFIQNFTKNSSLKEISKVYECSDTAMEFIIDTLSKPKNFDLRTLHFGTLFKKEIKKFEDISPGQTLIGVVCNVVSFGAFVDVGVEKNGLIHKSNMNNKVVQLNDKVEVKVLKVEPGKIHLQLLSVG